VANFGDRYELIRRIGSGGMGEVWLAHDEQLANRPVAIKIMHQHMLPNPGDVARFEREMSLAAMMEHPNIVTVYTTGTYDGAPFMVMEYLRGQDLQKATPNDGAERIAAIGRDICAALAYAHRKGVIHRDIKPGNLFLCDTGQVKVADFGIARAVGGTTLSSAGLLVGTFAYMSPEQWRGAAPAFSNDIWAAGCVLYRLLAGRLPRELPSAADYAAAAMRGDPIPDLRDISHAPAGLSAAVMAMLAHAPASRPTASDCLRLLSSAQSPLPVPDQPGTVQLGTFQPESRPAVGPGRGPVTVPLPPPAPVHAVGRRARRPGRFIMAAVGAAVLLVAGIVTVMQFQGGAQGSGPVASGSTRTVTGPATHVQSGSAIRPASASAPGSPTSSPAASAASTPKANPVVSSPTAGAAALAPIPNVIGMTYTKARLELLNAGFQVKGRHTRLGQTVTRTIPSVQAPAGSTVIVVYGAGA